VSGNSFGKSFVVTTFGESHGLALGCVVDGCPPGMELSEADIQVDLTVNLGQVAKVVGQHDADHLSVCTSTDITLGRSRTMASQVSPESGLYSKLGKKRVK